MKTSKTRVKEKMKELYCEKKLPCDDIACRDYRDTLIWLEEELVFKTLNELLNVIEREKEREDIGEGAKQALVHMQSIVGWELHG